MPLASPPLESKHNVDTEESPRIPIPEGCKISGFANGQSSDVELTEPEIVD